MESQSHYRNETCGERNERTAAEAAIQGQETARVAGKHDEGNWKPEEGDAKGLEESRRTRDLLHSGYQCWT